MSSISDATENDSMVSKHATSRDLQWIYTCADEISLGYGLYWARSQNYKEATISHVVSVRLSVGMEQLGSHWTDFR